VSAAFSCAHPAIRDIRGHQDYTAAVVRLDDEICYCYHVSMRKLVNFSRRVKPLRPSEMTGCLGAGTGCGWCIPFLVKIIIRIH